MPTRILAGRTRSLPSTEWLESGPGTGCGALGSIGVIDTSLDVLKEPRGLVFGSIETGGQAIHDIVGELHPLFKAADRVDHRDRQEHFLLPEVMGVWDVDGDRRLAEETLPILPIGDDLATGDKLARSLERAREGLEIFVCALVDHWSHKDRAIGWITNGDLLRDLG